MPPLHARWLVGSIAGALGLAGATGVVAPVLVPAAGAATSTGAYTAAASGTGLEIAVGGTKLLGGTSKASADGSTVAAEGIGEVTPGAVSDQKATVSNAGGSQTANRSCAQPANPFPAPLGSLLQLGLACGGASASQSATGVPSASATGQVATIGIASPSALPTTKVLPSSTLATKLTSILGPLPTIPSGGLPLPTLLNQVAKGVSGGAAITSLVQATAGVSTSAIAGNGTSVTASSKDTGIRLALLTGLGAGGGPLLTVAVGASSAQSSVDLTKGTVTSSDTPAAVTVTLDPPSGSPQTVSVAPGISQTFLGGTPLAVTVAVGGGSTSGNGTTHSTATATGVTIDALQGVGAGSTGTNGGIDLRLGGAATSASGTAPVAVPVAAAASSSSPAPPAPAPAPAVTGATTVHTGEPWAGPLPFVLLALSLLTGAGLLARRRLVPLVSLVGRATGHARRVASVSHAAAGPGLRGLLRSPSGPGTGPAASSSATSQGSAPLGPALAPDEVPDDWNG